MLPPSCFLTLLFPCPRPLCTHPHTHTLPLVIPLQTHPRELGFEGVPNRETVMVLPTVNCLVELTQMPFCVVSLSDIEIVNLERVGFNLKNFDMAIVFKVGVLVGSVGGG